MINNIIKLVAICTVLLLSYCFVFAEGGLSVKKNTRVVAFNTRTTAGSFFGKCLYLNDMAFCAVDQPNNELTGLAFPFDVCPNGTLTTDDEQHFNCRFDHDQTR